MHAIYLTTLLGAAVAATPSLAGRATFGEIAKVRTFLSLQASVLFLWPIWPLQFDELTGTTGVAISQVGTAGLYKQVVYRGFALADNRVPANLTSVTSSIITRPGVSPYSPTNAIVWGTTDIQTVLAGQALIDTDYLRSNIRYIELKRARLSCISASKAFLTAVAASCDINLTYNRDDDTQLWQKLTNFRVVGTQTRAPQVLAQPKDFTKCVSVKFGNPVSPGVLAARTVLAGVADNVEYTLTYKSWNACLRCFMDKFRSWQARVRKTDAVGDLYRTIISFWVVWTVKSVLSFY